MKKIDIKTSVHNKFDIEVIDAFSGQVKEKAQAYNIICNYLWSTLATNGSWENSAICYGTGSGNPAVTDEYLFDYEGVKASVEVGGSIDYENGIYQYKRYIQLEPSEAVGVEISEVAIPLENWRESRIFNHAMLEDMNGNPITIVKTATDIVKIYATIYVHFDNTGYNGIYFSNTNDNGILKRLCGASAEALAVDFARGRLIKGSVSDDVIASPHYEALTDFSSENKKLKIGTIRLQVANGNINGIDSIVVGHYYNYYGENKRRNYTSLIFDVAGEWYGTTQITAEPVGTGDGSTVNYKLDFPAPTDAVIKVDGVAVNATVDYAPADTDLTNYVKIIDEASTVDNHIPAAKLYQYQQLIVYNPYYLTAGITRLDYTSGSVYCSNDLITWIETESNIPTNYEKYKYYKFYVGNHPVGSPVVISDYSGYNVHFATAPSSGSVITADYKTPTIAKADTNVLDFNCYITFGEYEE